jgi:hypothetical protein
VAFGRSRAQVAMVPPRLLIHGGTDFSWRRASTAATAVALHRYLLLLEVTMLAGHIGSELDVLVEVACYHGKSVIL